MIRDDLMNKRKYRKIVLNLITITILLAILYLVFHKDYKAILDCVSNISLLNLLLLLAMGIGYQALDAAVCFTLVHERLSSFQFKQAVEVTFLGVFGNIATSTAGTIPLQSYYLYQQGMQVGSGMGLMILQYVFHKTTVFLYAAFMILIPIACVLYSASEIFKRNIWKQFAYKLVLFGLAIYLIVPVSVKVSDMIETTYQTSIEQTIDSAKQTTEEIKDSSDEEESSGVSGFISKVKDGVSDTTAKIQNVLNNFIEALAVMIVTSCLIPILVMIFFVWIIKSMLGMDMTGWKRIERI